jgi:hypothetical protein
MAGAGGRRMSIGGKEPKEAMKNFGVVFEKAKQNMAEENYDKV